MRERRPGLVAFAPALLTYSSLSSLVTHQHPPPYCVQVAGWPGTGIAAISATAATASVAHVRLRRAADAEPLFIFNRDGGRGRVRVVLVINALQIRRPEGNELASVHGYPDRNDQWNGPWTVSSSAGEREQRDFCETSDTLNEFVADTPFLPPLSPFLPRVEDSFNDRAACVAKRAIHFAGRDIAPPPTG